MMNIALIMLATGDLTPKSKSMKNVDYWVGIQPTTLLQFFLLLYNKRHI